MALGAMAALTVPGDGRYRNGRSHSSTSSIGGASSRAPSKASVARRQIDRQRPEEVLDEVSSTVLLGRLHSLVSYRLRASSSAADGLLDRPISADELEQLLGSFGWTRCSEKTQIILRTLGIPKKGRVHLFDALEHYAEGGGQQSPGASRRPSPRPGSRPSSRPSSHAGGSRPTSGRPTSSRPASRPASRSSATSNSTGSFLRARLMEALKAEEQVSLLEEAKAQAQPPEWLLRACWQLRNESAQVRMEGTKKLLERMDSARRYAPFFVGALSIVLRQDHHADLRAAAARALGELGTIATWHVETLASALQDLDTSVRSAALGALAALGPETSEQCSEVIYHLVMSDPEKEVRHLAAQVLGMLGEDTAADYAEQLADSLDGDSDVSRLRAAQALAAMGPAAEPYAELLRQASLHDSKAGVRLAAAKSLGALGSGGAAQVKQLVETLQEGDRTDRRAAATALGSIERLPQASGLLSAVLQDTDEVVRWRAAAALGSLGTAAGPKVQELVSTALGGDLGAEEEEVRKPKRGSKAKLLDSGGTALFMATKLGGPKPAGSSSPTSAASSPSAAATESAVSPTQQRAIEALGALGGAAAPHVEKLAAALNSKGAASRRQGAAQALAVLGTAGPELSAPWSPSVASALTGVLRDEDAIVRRHTAIALGGLREEAVPHIGALTNSLHDNNVQARKSAFGSLGRLRSEASPHMEAHLQLNALNVVAPCK